MQLRERLPIAASKHLRAKTFGERKRRAHDAFRVCGKRCGGEQRERCESENRSHGWLAVGVLEEGGA